MDTRVRELVRVRAEFLCEYCRLRQSDSPYFTFHIEHIRARQHGGTDDPQNLALACPDCNAKKGPNLAAISPLTGELVELFNPRIHQWDEHFALVGVEIVGLTEIGQATVRLLDMNEEERLTIRSRLRDDE